MCHPVAFSQALPDSAQSSTQLSLKASSENTTDGTPPRAAPSAMPAFIGPLNDVGPRRAEGFNA